MAPSGRRSTRRITRKPRGSQYKKRLDRSQNEEASVDLAAKSSSSTTTTTATTDGGVDVTTSGCSTPKGQRFQIPEISTCPPAPKKQRVLSNCSLRRTPIAFFAPPDLELFFFFALRDVPV
ncbi:hypothetical protein HYC85_024722 [Camellia sinensis]|uniref:Cyclin-dependent protein kinase inhibitor SMR13 n=1 Tax=Camellia sinensis TaxID=4442 RepID=A0A7J7GD48_CAMSI|nr:hypothetical protein HYC85_024722 [Camellia sinensis]